MTLPVPSPLLERTLYDTLTPREQEVADQLARGFSCRDIAPALGISIKTVDTHRGHVLQKLKLKNNVELCRFMIRAALVIP
jgi:DNA-binding NarL/FixJ family response regulator